ncbi:MAG: glycosyltransferase involved in cell wall biosynthesis [Porticoccus sp.]
MILNIVYSSGEAHKSTQLIHQLISQVCKLSGMPVHDYFLVNGDIELGCESSFPVISSAIVVKKKGVWRYVPSRLTNKIAKLVRANHVKLVVCDGLGVARCMFPVLKVDSDLKLIVVVHGVVKFKPQDLANFNNYCERVRLVFVSSSLAKKMQHCYPVLSRVSHVIANALSPDFSQELAPKIDARYELGLPADKKLYLVASRLSVKKDVSTVIRAFAKIVDAEKYLVIMGDGPDLANLEKLSVDLGLVGSVIWLGWVKDSNRYLKAFDVFVSASISEGFGLSVLEAHVAGLPVICSDIEPHKEALGENAAYFSVGDKEDCAAKLLVDLRPFTNCSLDVKYQKFCSSYREILSF